jgi:hypothetical protein
VRGHVHTRLAAQMPQRLLERGIGQRAPVPAAEHHPRWIFRTAEPALLSEIAGEHRPEIIADRHAMLIPRALEPHHDRARPTIQISEAHPENPVLAVHRAPIPDPLTRTPQQRQQRPVPLRASRVEQPHCDLRLDPSRQPPRNALAVLAAAAAADHITTRHPMRPVHRRAPDRHGTRPITQRPEPTITVTPLEEFEERRQHAQPVIHRPRLAPEREAILAPVSERDDVLADDPPIDIDQPDPVPINPAQEMRQPQPVRPLRIRPTAAARQPPQELARLASPKLRPGHHEPRPEPARHTQVDLNRERSRHVDQPLPRR